MTASSEQEIPAPETARACATGRQYELRRRIQELRATESSDLAAFNALMRELNVPAVLVPAPPIVP